MSASDRQARLMGTTDALRTASFAALDRAPTLEQWMLDRSHGTRCLVGFVYGHPDFPEGQYVRTSTVRRFVPEIGWARTVNRYYKLGVSFEDWRKSR